MGRQWKWVRQDPARETLVPGSLVITPTAGNVNGNLRTVRNLLLQPALGDWTIQSKLTLSRAPSAEGEEAGIIAYQDDGDYLKLGWGYSSGEARLMETTQDSLSGAAVTQQLASFPMTAGRTLWLRTVKRGPRYTTYFSRNGVHFVRLYEGGASLVNVRVGLFAWGGADTNNSLQSAFAYFHLRESGFRVGTGAPAAPPAKRRHHAHDVARPARTVSRSEAVSQSRAIQLRASGVGRSP